MTNKAECLWCGFEREQHPKIEHCDKMITRALTRPRKNGDGCHHCGHTKKEHRGKSYIILDDETKILEKNTICNHLKLDKRRSGEDSDDYCECDGYL